MHRIASLILVVLLPASGGIVVQAAESCHVSFPSSPLDSRNFFTLAQEADLGDALAESQFLNLRILSEDDPYLQRIATRLVSNTPLSSLHIRTFLVDIPQANAFVIPGGRVYVSRALLPLLQSEDELAGVLAHELGHLLAHQQAILISRLMKADVGFTSVGDRGDIFDKYARTLENEWRKPDQLARVANSEEKDQMEADRLGLLMQAAAGYDPKAQIAAIDRILETKGKTSNFLSNLFNFAPNQKRLGELLKNMPPECALAAASPAGDFVAWRKGILTSATVRFSESLPDVQSRVPLQPRLRGDLRGLRFSPNGSHVLALDDASIVVLTVEPFSVAFRIPAENASTVEFTPDSQQLVFLSSATHVERWNVSSQSRADSLDIPLHKPCLTETLSPNASVVACVDGSGTLRLLDVASGETIFEKAAFARQWELPIGADDSRGDWSFRVGVPGAASMSFSPDARYFLALPTEAMGPPIAWDLQHKAAVALRGELKKLQGRNLKLPASNFTFVAADRLMVSPPVPTAKMGGNVTAAVVAFPSGEVVARPTLPSGPLYRAADPASVLVRPLGRFAVGAVEYGAGNVITNKVPALDVFGKFYVAERATGELALYERGAQLVATVQLPEVELNGLSTSTISTDLRWAAASSGARGAVWNLRTGQRITQLPAFSGGFFDSNGLLLIDVPKLDERERHSVGINLDTLQSEEGPDIKSRLAAQAGPWVVDIRTEDGSPPRFVRDTSSFEDVTMDVLDARTMKAVWSRKFRGEAPRYFLNPSGKSAVFLWTSTSERVKRDPAVNDLLRLAPSPKSDERSCYFSDFWHQIYDDPLTTGLYIAEAVDLSTGEAKTPVAVDLVDRCLRIKSASYVGPALLIEDNRNRVLVFRADNPHARIRLFGHLLATDPVRNRIAVAKEAGHVVIYSAANGEQIEDFRFPATVVMVHFRSDGEALFALTSTQEAITLRVR